MILPSKGYETVLTKNNLIGSIDFSAFIQSLLNRFSWHIFCGYILYANDFFCLASNVQRIKA